MGIRKLVAAAVSAVTLLAGAAHAETALSVYVAGQVDWADVEAGPVDDEFTNGAVSGAVAFPLAGNWGMQLDARAVFLDEDLGSDDDVFAGTAHIFHRTAGGLIGAFLGAASIDDETAFGGGVEGAAYLGNFTLAGDFTYAELDDAGVNYWEVGASATYFYGENIATNITATFGNVESGSDDSDVYSVGLGGEYQFSSVPIGLGAQLTYANADDFDRESTSVALVARYVFTGESLRARNRTGASQRGFLAGAENVAF